MKKAILELIKKIYGSNALSKVLGTRTNVIRLPDNELKQYTNKELNIEAASDKLAQKAKTDINELLAEYPQMNDAEKLFFEGNLTRLGNRLGVTEKKQGPAADVIKFGTGEKVSPEGVMSLTEKIGQKNAPGTLVGNLESRIKQLEASDEELSKLKGKTYDEFMKDITQGQKAMRKLEDEGLVRAAAREIINKDIKSGKIKLPKEIEQDMVQGGGEPINVLRQFYGEGALEQLDSMIPEFKKMYSPKEAADAATKKFKFEFKADRPPGSTSIEDAKKTKVMDLKTEATKRKSVDDLIDEYNANQDRLRLSDKEGGTLIGYEEYEQLRKRNKDISKALEDKGISSKVEKKPEAEIIPFTNKPDPEDFATGGRAGYAKGGILKLAMKFFNDNNPVSAYKKYLKYVKETAQKDPAKLAPEVGGIVVGSELIHRGLRRKLKEVKEKNNENDSENLETDNRKEKAGGGVSQGLDYLMGINRTGFQEGGTTEDKELSNPTMTSMVMPSIRSIQNFFSNPIVQGVGSFMLGGMPALGNYAKGQIGGYLTGKAISPMVQARLAAESFRDQAGDNTGNTNTGNTGFGDDNDGYGNDGDGYATGGRVGYAGGSILKTIGKKLIKKPKTETTSIDPIIDENVDLSKRGFLKGAAGVGAGIAAFGSGALKLAKKGAKEVKDLDVVFRKNYDGEYVDGTPTVFSEIIADIVPYTKKAKTFLEDMVKQKKVIKNNDGSYFVDVQDIHDMGGDIGVFKDIGNKFNYKTFKTDNYVDIEEIKDLRSYSSPLKNNPTYGPIDFEDDAAEYVADALQPKTAKEIIKERTNLIERKLKERGDFAGGGLGYLQGL
jgi:hypothetical protein